LFLGWFASWLSAQTGAGAAAGAATSTGIPFGPAGVKITIANGADPTISYVGPALGTTPANTDCRESGASEELKPLGKSSTEDDKPHSKSHLCSDADLARPFVKLRYAVFPGQKWSDPITKEKVLQNGNEWKLTELAPGLRRLLYLEVGTTCKERPKLCYYRVLLVNRAKSPEREHDWVLLLRATTEGLKINSDPFQDRSPDLTFVINGTPLSNGLSGLTFGSPDIGTYHVEVYENAEGCRKYTLKYETGTRPESIDVEIPLLRLTEKADTGIHVGAPKVYDSYLLRSRLNAAAAQLAAISPWNATAITNAYGTTQGITRDTSYLAAQVQTTATPSQVVTTNTGSPTLSPTVTNTQTAQCPAGYFASQISTTGVTCTQLPQPSQGCPDGYYASSANPLICSQLPVTAPGSQLPPATFSSTQKNAAPQAAQVQTTVPSLSPTIPTAPASNPFSAPTNLSVSSADMLAEQVQLNAQLQMYQMLLQGSQSDQFLVRNSLAVATRAQTTIGFQISLAPPRQYKHAVAEVRVVIVPHPPQDQSTAEGGGRVSVVNLLPSQKTYNVAKITSHQNAFGAGAVVEQVNVGINTGRSKDRLYLAKDTDTVALEYPILPTPELKPPFPEQVLETIEELIKEQPLGECPKTWEGDRPALERASVMFGWQFRPVLGAEYVTAGPREVFAQLALPSELEQEGFAPAVYVQTRWREYNEKRQVVGPVYRDSCVWTRAQDSISILSPLRVHDVSWEDVGNGILKVRAEGKFFASGMMVMSAGTNIPPTTFDGRTIQFFAPAHDLLQNGDMQLLGENGRTTSLVIPVRDFQSCGIEWASMKAVPYPDGNSRVELQVRYKSGYQSMDGLDGPLHPLVLIGSDVYGLQSKPFQDYEAEDWGSDSWHHRRLSCTYHFLAPTDSLRSAQNALVRDIAWEKFSKVIPIRVGPTFASLTPLPASSNADGSSAPVSAQEPPAAPAGNPGVAHASARGAGHASASHAGGTDRSAPDKSVWYSVTGTGFQNFFDNFGNPHDNLKVYLDDSVDGRALTTSNFRPLSDTTALLQLDHAPKAKTVKIAWDPKADHYVSASLPVVWDLQVPAEEKEKVSASPAFLYAGDSQIVIFTGSFKNSIGVYFETTNTLLTPDPGNKFLDSKKLAVPVTLVVTKVPGHKQLEVKTVDDKGKPGKSIYLDIDVLRR
jgi:hypothetical protein